MLRRPEYRIVFDNYLGYEVQYRTWWWPFWRMPICNTHASIESAERFAEAHAERTVKYLGRFTP